MERHEDCTMDVTVAVDTNVEVTESNRVLLSPVEDEKEQHTTSFFAESKDESNNDNDNENDNDSNMITPESDLSNVNRKIWIVTTAGLPWRTGTAVNPLMRALYLCRGRARHAVTLVIPWLSDPKSRQKLYGMDSYFENKQEQEAWIRNYCRTSCNCPEEEELLRIKFWEGSYHAGFGSIFPTQDICSLIPDKEADVAILEEPEHLNWFRVPATPQQMAAAAAGDTDEKKEKVDDKKGSGDNMVEGQDMGDMSNHSTSSNADSNNVLGWAHKFRFVVGILHTNYGAYIRQYGMGTSLVTAPALNALSALVIKAYCHRVIRLSGTLTSFDSSLEVTCNVHGVRSEFLDKPKPKPTTSSSKNAPVYFVGKLIWAKGFDKVLEVQELFHEATGEYFAMDVYGGGDDSKSIQRAFFGRHGKNTVANKDAAETSEKTDSDTSEEDNKRAAHVFECTSSLRELVVEHASEHEQAGEAAVSESAVDPLDVLGDLSGKTLKSGAMTLDASVKLIESVLQNGIGAFVGEKSCGDNDDNKKIRRKHHKGFTFIPHRARFKWRLTPIPARFLGVLDHVQVRDIPEQQVFLNMSITEVLCTTSAEALAMSKFVILPKHPSNEFFLQFPNCLAYEDLDDCVRKLQYALAHKPETLSTKHSHMLSWDGATDRLFKASGISKREAEERHESGKDVEYQRCAKFHVDTAKKSHFVTNLFSAKTLRKYTSSLSNIE